MELIRDGKPMTLSIRIGEQPDDMRAAIAGEKPEEQVAKSSPKAEPENALGLSVRPLTQEVAAQLGYDGLKGVLVEDVSPDSPAAEAGFRKGSLIVQVNRKPVESLSAFRRVLGKSTQGKHVLFLVRTGPATQFLAVKMP